MKKAGANNLAQLQIRPAAPEANSESVRALLSPLLMCGPHLLGPRHRLSPPSEFLARDRVPPITPPFNSN
jgi:hypothetical protein